MRPLQLCVSILLVFFLGLEAQAASVDPAIDWDVIRTPHFKIIYDKKLKNLARLYAWQAERAHSLLKPIFKKAPDLTHVLISDTSDFANGFASFLPLPLITVFPVLPSAIDSVSHYDNWAAELMIHEYTHILTFEPTAGFYTPLRYIFGSLIHPTGLLPSWWQEGLAVEMETRFTLFGRLRSPSYGATLRNLVLGEKLRAETLDRINEGDIPTWPFGQRPYLFGSLIWNKLQSESEQGADLAPNLLERYSHRFPFLLNEPLKDNIGKTYQTVLSELYGQVEDRATEQLKTINHAKVKTETRLSHPGTGQHSPMISPNGRMLAYLAYIPRQSGEIRLVERPEGSNASFSTLPYQVVKKMVGTTRISWLPDSTGFVYDQMRTYKRYYRYRDLYLYNLANKTTVRLTQGARASEPSVSPDGNKVAFVQTTPGSTRLAIYDIEKGEISTLLEPPKPQMRISSPEFVTANEIIFAARNLRGQEGLFRLRLDNPKPVAMLNEFRPARQPRMTPVGLLFVSDRSGVSNLYIANKSLTEARALTNTKTQIVNAEADRQSREYLVAQSSPDGTVLFFGKDVTTANPPTVEPFVENRWQKIPEGPQLSEVKMKEEDFSSWPYLYPRYWIPFLYPVEGGVLVQGTTTAGDPLGKHSYALDLSYDTVTEKPSYGVNYLNGTTSIDWSLFYTETQDYYAGFDTTLTNRAAGTSAGFYLPKLSDRWRGSLGYVAIETENVSSQVKRQGPSASFSYSTFVSGEGESEEDEESAEEDQVADYNTQIAIGHTQYQEGPELVDYGRTSLTWNQVITKWLPARHSLVTQLRAAFSPQMNLSQVIGLGDKTVGGNYIASLVTSSFLMRGYPSTSFVGRRIVNANLEYRFPLTDVFRGKDLVPIFLKDISATVFADGVAVDGGAFDPELGGYRRVELDRQFYAAGLELKLRTTMAYQFPVTYILGAYYGFDQQMQGGFHPFIGVGIGGISDIEKGGRL